MLSVLENNLPAMLELPEIWFSDGPNLYAQLGHTMVTLYTTKPIQPPDIGLSVLAEDHYVALDYWTERKSDNSMSRDEKKALLEIFKGLL